MIDLQKSVVLGGPWDGLQFRANQREMEHRIPCREGILVLRRTTQRDPEGRWIWCWRHTRPREK